jgi:hypothetical protein
MRHKQLSESTGVLAGLASAIAVIIGYLAARATPKGLAKLSMAMHLTRPPLIVRIAPVLTGIAVALATVASLYRFYTWWLERRAPREDSLNENQHGS